jgi:hypothetical protein
MSFKSKLKQCIYPGVPLVILSLFLMGQDGCLKKTPWGIIMVFEHPNCAGRCFTASFNNSSGAIKWDNYDFADIVGDNKISSFKIFPNKATTVILCEKEHFRGRYYWLNAKPGNGWIQVGDLSNDNFNDITSSIIVTHEDLEKSQVAHTRIELSVTAVEEFRDGVKKEVESNDKIESISHKEAQILWDTKLNYKRTYEGYTYNSSTYKNSDVIQFYIKFDANPNWWPKDYEVRLRFWIEPTNIGGLMGFKGYSWNVWVEKGWIVQYIRNKIYNSITESMPKSLQDLASKIDEGIRVRIREKWGLEVEKMLTRDIERISFTQPEPGDTSKINPYAGVAPWRIESTPPVIILQHIEAKTAAKARVEDQSKAPAISDKSPSIQSGISAPSEKSPQKTDEDKPEKISRKFSPEIINNIKKLGFKDEQEYREKLLLSLGITKENEKNVKILQMSYNGVPGVSVSCVTSIDDLTEPSKLDTPTKETDKKKVVAELRDLLTKLETSSSISISQVNRLIVLMNEATRLGVMKPAFQGRFDKLIENKTKQYLQ